VINRWVLTRHDDVERVLRDRTMSLDPHKANEGTYMRLFLPARGQAANMLFSDPPAHTRLRALVNKAFTPRAVERLAPPSGGSLASCSAPSPEARASISSRRSRARCR
jgi:cytochrome P450